MKERIYIELPVLRVITSEDDPVKEGHCHEMVILGTLVVDILSINAFRGVPWPRTKITHHKTGEEYDPMQMTAIHVGPNDTTFWINMPILEFRNYFKSLCDKFGIAYISKVNS